MLKKLLKTIVGQLRNLRKYFHGRITSPVYQLILEIANKNRFYIGALFGANLLTSSLEAGTFGVIYLALGVLVGDVTLSGVNNPFIANSIMQSWFEKLSPGQTFVFLVVMAMIIQIIKSIIQYISALGSTEMAINMREEVSDRLFSIVLKLSFPCASNYKVGDLLAYTGGSGRVLGQIQLWQGLIVESFTFLSYLSVILWISPVLSIFGVILSAAIFAFQRYLAPRFERFSLETTNIGVEVAKEATETVQALRLIHTFGKQKQAIRKVRKLRRKIIPVQRKTTRWGSLSGPINSTLTIMVVGGLLIVGFGILGQSTRVRVPALLVFISAFNRLATQAQRVTGTLDNLAGSFGQMTRLNEILDPTDKEFARLEGKQFTGLKRGVIFDRVSLRYQEGKDFALKDLSFSIDKGKVVALVGSSGAGKSSIADLLVGLYNVTEGAIIVDGINLNEYSPPSWRSRLGVVSQDTFIFNTNILDNIRYGMREEVSEEQVIEAAKQAQAHEFIVNLPRGYDTVVGERGYRLSGGQRQRIALARAILKQPEILILDEATSALDSQSERLVQEALGKFQSDRTALVIAHRLSTIVNADEIIVLEFGRVVERGNHRELIALGGLYARYWQLQSQGSELVT